MKLSTRCIMMEVWRALLQVLLLLASVQFFLGLLAEVDQIGQGHYGLPAALYNVLLRLPSQTYALLPAVSVLAGLLALGRMSKASELIALRAAGVSVASMLRAVLWAAAAAALALAVIGEGVGPYAAERAYAYKQQALSSGKAAPASQAIWLRQGNSMVRVASVGGAELDDYTRYTFPQNSHEVFRVVHADYGFRSGGRWWLKDARTLRFTPQRVEALPVHATHVRLNAHPEALLVAGDATQRESLLQLVHAMHVQHQAGLNTASLRFRFWQRMLQPLTMMLLLSIAVPFAFGHARDHSMGFKMMLGLMLAFAYDMVRQFLGPLSLIYRVPVFYTVLLPPVLLFLLLFFLFRVQQRA